MRVAWQRIPVVGALLLLVFGPSAVAIQERKGLHSPLRFCLSAIGPPNGIPLKRDLGDLRERAGTTVAFTDPLPERMNARGALTSSEEVRVGYEVAVRATRDLPTFLRQIVLDLAYYSSASGNAYETGLVALRYAEYQAVAFYASGHEQYNFEATLNDAYQRLIRKVSRAPEVLAAIQDDAGDGIEIHQMHTHLPWFAAPHSAYDVIRANQRLPWLRRLFGSRVGYFNHVLPLEYLGDLIFTFDPREHRLY